MALTARSLEQSREALKWRERQAFSELASFAARQANAPSEDMLPRRDRAKSGGSDGLEPATFGVTGRRSNQLSYTPLASTARQRPGAILRHVGLGFLSSQGNCAKRSRKS